MLFKKEFHAGLRDGSTDLTFRRWSQPKVKVGGRYRFGAGELLEVDAIDQLAVGSITDAMARRAGFPSRSALHEALAGKGATRLDRRTRVYRVAFHYAGEAGAGPATDADLPADALRELAERLRRSDRLSSRGPWTAAVLTLIARHPRRAASQLAPRVDRELRSFKADVRKLKRLGLTISHETGYEITPRGRRVLEQLRADS